MSIEPQDKLRNRLLSLMAPQDFMRLVPHLEPMKMPKRFMFLDTDEPIEFVYFMEVGVGSVIATSPEGHEVESGLVGCDGLAPVGAILGADVSPNRFVVKVAGEGHRISCKHLIAAMNASTALRDLLLRYVQVFNTQTSCTALSNAVHRVDERLARWLLMCHDRHPSDDIPLTHDLLSITLGVRRPSITMALHVLEGNGFISSDRGYVLIRDRKALEDFARDGYGKSESEYRRLVGPMKRAEPNLRADRDATTHSLGSSQRSVMASF